jgi:lipopolysaccharide transport system ATP-binding protein
MDCAIRVEGLSKHYRIGAQSTASYRTLREALAEQAASLWRPLERRFRGKRPPASSSEGEASRSDRFWALKEVNFAIEPGEVVGIIGRNGAGKSTLLKILSRITEPSSGRCTLRGRIGSLLEVGTGFHPELTGRENIYLNGSILGMSRREIDRKFDEIVAFAEIEKFLDTPVKRYSSGMYVRLAFAVAAHLEPEILLVDEVLAVGDQKFQKKCLGKMREVGRSGRTILFVSHNAAALESLCERCVLIERGRVTGDGETRTLLARYFEDDQDRASGRRDLAEHRGRTPGSSPIMTWVGVEDSDGSISSQIRMGSDLTVSVDFDVKGFPTHPVLGVVIKTDLGAPLLGVNNRFIPGYEFDAVECPSRISCRFKDLPLMPGAYVIDLYFGNESRDLDVVHEAITFEVVPADVFGSGKLPPKAAGPIFWPATWELRAAVDD